MTDALSLHQYDGLTRRYFRLLTANQESIGPADDATVQERETGRERSETDSVLHLKNLLDEVGIGSDVKVKGLLPSPGQGSAGSGTPLLDLALNMLQSDSESRFLRRRDEVLYLANVLALGTGMHGLPFTEANAVKAVRATCNLGLEYISTHQNIVQQELYFELLSAEPGMLRPFSVGFTLLNQVPRDCVVSLTAFLADKRLTSKLDRLPSIAAQLEDVWPGDRLLPKVESGQFDELKSDIQTLALVLEQVAVHCLDHLVDSFPVFPRILSMDPPPIRLDTSIRFISRLEDLQQIERYVGNLRIDI
jgi:hypothetical protein